MGEFVKVHVKTTNRGHSILLLGDHRKIIQVIQVFRVKYSPHCTKKQSFPLRNFLQ